jgi:CHAT domain
LKTAKVLGCCLLLFPLVGTVIRSVPTVKAKSLAHSEDSSQRIPLLAELRTIADVFRAGHYYINARAAGNIGVCQFAPHQNRSALEPFLEARRLAHASGDVRWMEGTHDRLSNAVDRRDQFPKLATHMLKSADRLSGQIAHWKIRSGLVVLSGCHSAAREVLPRTGLPGLARAWFAAGVDDVIDTRCATTDDTGVLFSAFYGNLRAQAGPNPAQALRAAQLEMMHPGIGALIRAIGPLVLPLASKECDDHAAVTPYRSGR